MNKIEQENIKCDPNDMKTVEFFLLQCKNIFLIWIEIR